MDIRKWAETIKQYSYIESSEEYKPSQFLIPDCTVIVARIRAEARAEALRDAADRAAQWWYMGDVVGYDTAESLKAAILAGGSKK